MMGKRLMALPLPGVLLAVLMVPVLNGCTSTHAVTIGTDPDLEAGGYPPYPARFEIPPGHRPPPGQCRIWFPDQPPGHQPPPGNCQELEYRVPSDAVLIRG